MRRLSFRVLAIAAVGLSGCAQTSKVEGDVSTATLAQQHKGVALMRIGSASTGCRNVAVLLGTRDGDHYRRGEVIKVANVRSVSEPAVAEVALSPGEHHVLGYACQSERDTKTVMDKADGQNYRTSYAHFTVKPGEVVNVGYFQFGASHVGRSAFGRPLKLDVSVTDWPLRELEQFKASRSALYAQMTTRLMIVGDGRPKTPGEDECRRMKSLAVEGKMQALPAACGGAAPAAATAGRPRST